jgi:hypothetical protein
MKFPLSTEIRDLLRKHLAESSSARIAVENAIYFRGNRVDQHWVNCTPQEANEFLAAAKEHFPNRVREIEQEIKQAAR